MTDFEVRPLTHVPHNFGTEKLVEDLVKLVERIIAEGKPADPAVWAAELKRLTR